MLVTGDSPGAGVSLSRYRGSMVGHRNKSRVEEKVSSSAIFIHGVHGVDTRRRRVARAPDLMSSFLRVRRAPNERPPRAPEIEPLKRIKISVWRAELDTGGRRLSSFDLVNRVRVMVLGS